MDKELEALKVRVRSEDWDTCRSAVDRLAAINSDASTSILLDMLKSSDAQVRNLAAIAMRETKNQNFLIPLLQRLKDLGPKGQIGTLVQALENLDCSKNLFDIANLNLNAGTNMEVKNSTTVILNEQTFRLTKKELEQVKKLLDKFDFTIEGFDAKFEVID
jgi:hypothetical protein